MIYPQLQRIKTQIEKTGLFKNNRVKVTKTFQIGGLDAGTCIITSGQAQFDRGKNSFRSVAHILVNVYAEANEEKALHNHIAKILDWLKREKDIVPVYFTTDSDLYEPWGVVYAQVSPHFAFRLDVEICGVWPMKEA